MRKKGIIFIIIFSFFCLLLNYKVNASAESLNNLNESNDEKVFYINESYDIDIEKYDKVYVNEKLQEESVILKDSGIYNIKTSKKEIVDEESEIYKVSLNQFDIVILNINIDNNEVYYGEKEINLCFIEGINYYINEKLIEENVIINNEGHNELKITYNDKSTIINFDIFKIHNEEELAFKNLYNLVSLDYTKDTLAKIYLNGNLFDGNIDKIGVYDFVIKNSKDEEIHRLSFIIEETIKINDKEYKAINSNISLEKPINASTSAKIEYLLDTLNTILNDNNIHSEYITYNPGKNNLTILGIGGYKLNIEFNITPSTNIIDNHTYVKEVLPIVSGGNVTLNGYPFNLGSIINTTGDYELVISGINEANVKTIHFSVIEEEFNITNTSFNQAIIPVINNNYMLLNNNIYNSGSVISDTGSYVFEIYCPTYENILSENNPYNDDTYIKSKYYYKKEYKFDINVGINIINNMEYFDNIRILYSGTTKALLNGIEISSGYLVDKIGNYELEFNDKTYKFIVSPKLNVVNDQLYVDSVSVINSYDFNYNNATFTLTAETGNIDSNINTYKNEEILALKLSAGTYSLKIINDKDYLKIINFIVVSKNVVSRGSAYNNGKIIDVNMFGVNVYLNSPNTKTHVNEKALYNKTPILTVGKHYLTFEFNLNNQLSKTYDESAIYFYILPVVSINDINTNDRNLNSDSTAVLSFKDGNGIDIEYGNHKCLKLDMNSRQSQIENIDSKYIFDEVGYHYITIILDDYSYQIKLTIDSYFYQEDKINTYSSTKNETYLTTQNIFNNEATIINKDNSIFLLDGKEINSDIINVIGNHKLVLKGTNNYEKVLIFVIKENVLINEKQINPTIKYEDLVFIDEISFNILGDASYLIDGSEYINNSNISTVGNHILKIKGSNDYIVNYYFTIKEKINISLDNELSNSFNLKYYKAFNFTINKSKIKEALLNDKEIDELTNINIIGNYKLVIIGENSYKSIYEFSVIPTLNFISNDSNEFMHTYKNKVTPMLDSSLKLSVLNAKLNDLDYGFETIDTINKYNLVLEGVGNYKINYEFKILESILYSFDRIKYYPLDKNLKVEDESIGKKIYLKKEFKDIKYINVKLNKEIVDEKLLNDCFVVDTLGNNKLVINDNTYSIKLLELNDNLFNSEKDAIDNKIDNLASISFKDDLKYTILLDDDIYDSTNIKSFGLHKVKLIGVDYENTYYFYINLDTNIINNNTYYNNVLIESNANNKLVFASNISISDELLNYAGNYEITFIDLYGNKEIYNIKLASNLYFNDKVITDISTDELIKLNYLDSANIYKEVLLNGHKYDFNTINTIGNNKLTLIDINGNEANYTLTINSNNYIKSIIYNDKDLAINNLFEEYELSLNEEYSAKILLDGNDDLNLINRFGNHKITVIGLNGYSKDYYFSIKLKSNVNNNDVFFNDINIDINANYVIDDEKTNNFLEVGNHKITIYKQNFLDFEEVFINFTLKEKLNINNLDTYNDSDKISPKIINNLYAKILIDDKDNINIIQGYGKHEIKVVGTNGYENIYYININLDTNLDDIIYNSSFEIKANSDIYVNNVKTNKLSLIGYNEITFKGLDKETKRIVLLKENINSNNNKYVRSHLIKLNNVSGIIIDNLSYASNENKIEYLVNEVGNHTFKVIGLNDYISEEYNFTVIEDLALLNNTCKFDHEITISVDNVDKLLLNGREINNNYNVSLIGDYVLTIIGKNNYSNNYNFTITYTIEGIEDGKTYVGCAKAVSFNTLMYLDGIAYNSGDLIYEVGYHTLVVKGYDSTNSYSYNFLIIPDLSNNEIINDYENNNVIIHKPVEFHVDPKSNLKLYLNDELYDGSLISCAGCYKLLLLGSNDYKKTFNFSLTPEYEDINGTYESSYTPKISDELDYELYLNNEKYIPNTLINNVGNYKFLIKGINYIKEFNFTLKEKLNINNLDTYNDSDKISPKIINNLNSLILIDGLDIKTIEGFGRHEIKVIGVNNYINTYYVDINLESNVSNNDIFVKNKEIIINSSFKINDNLYQNNANIDLVGNHQIVVIGFGGLKQIINFTIKEEVKGLINNGIYDTCVSFIINNAELLLDGHKLNSTVITSVGNHVLEVIGLNGYKNIYKFRINNKEFIDNQEVLGSLLIDIPNALLFVDDVKIDNNTLIDEIGNHTLKVLGTNDYIKEYHFVITPNNNISYLDNERGITAVINVLNKPLNIMVDDVLYENSSAYSKVGNHTLTINGVNGYSYSTSFTIEAKTGLVNDGNYNEKVVVNTLNTDEMILDGKELTKDKVISNGTHTLVIKGTNGYEKIITFSYDNPYYLYIWIYTIILAFVVVSSYVVIYVRKKKGEKR